MVVESGGALQVEVCYASPDAIWRRCVQLCVGDTVEDAIRMSGLLRSFPEFIHAPPALGVFGRACSLQQVLQPGDRVEVYRPLVFDPMESRRRRARHRERRAASKLSAT